MPSALAASTFLGFGHAGQHHIRKLRHALGLGSLDATVAGKDGEVFIDLHRVAVADAAIDGAELVDLLLAVGPRVVGVRYEFVDWCHRVVLGKYLYFTHQYSPHSAKASKPPTLRMYSLASSTISL